MNCSRLRVRARIGFFACGSRACEFVCRVVSFLFWTFLFLASLSLYSFAVNVLESYEVVCSSDRCYAAAISVLFRSSCSRTHSCPVHARTQAARWRHVQVSTESSAPRGRSIHSILMRYIAVHVSCYEKLAIMLMLVPECGSGSELKLEVKGPARPSRPLSI